MVGTHLDNEKCKDKRHLELIAEQVQNKFGDLCSKLWFVSCETGENIEKLKSFCYSLAWKAKLVGNKLPSSYLSLEARYSTLQCSVVWCGVVWCGVVWCWCGVW